MKTDVLVLGAGMVGVSTALHLQARGRDVILIDRRGAAEETSYGNAGLIQREGVVPYTFPAGWRQRIDYALNRSTEANIHYLALPGLLPWLWHYWRHSSSERILASINGLRPLVERCISEHEALMATAGGMHLIRRTGYVRLFRSSKNLNEAAKVLAEQKALYGISYDVWAPGTLQQQEPHLNGLYSGAIHLSDPWSVSDPGALGKGYADQFIKLGGRIVTADARTLEPLAGSGAGSGAGTNSGWQAHTVDGTIEARDAVIALGPWSAEVLRPLGHDVPLGTKRGYHMHYRVQGNATLNRPVLDDHHGFLLTPMIKGIRMTTGAEFARMGAPSTPVQVEKCETLARAVFPLAERVEQTAWLGRRPCFPDMLPMIGPVPGREGLWVNTGHQHLGLTLGPVTGRLLAEMMTGQPAFTDPYPYRVDRF